MRPPKGFQPKIFQEPKRHFSEKVVRNRDEQGTFYSAPTVESPHADVPKSASQFYHSQLQSHPSGVSTPPPPGIPYYPMPQQYQQPTYGHYSTNTLPQAFVQGFQSLQLEDPQQYPGMPPGYYPYYMGYQQPMAGYMPGQPMMQVPPQYYPPAQPVSPGGSKKRRSPMRPSQFRPASGSFAARDYDHGEHNAANEESIVAIIKEFEDRGSDTTALKGKIPGLAVTQTGSRFLQKQLTKASPSFVSFVLQEVRKIGVTPGR